MTRSNIEKQIRDQKGWVLIIITIWTLSIGIVAVAIVLPDRFASVSFSYGAFGIALASHFLSVGNTAYSCGASLKSQVILDDAYQITTYGIYTAGGAIITFLSGALSILLSQGTKLFDFKLTNVSLADPSSFTPLLYASLFLGSSIIAVSVSLQSKYSRWYEQIYEEINNDNPPPRFAS